MSKKLNKHTSQQVKRKMRKRDRVLVRPSFPDGVEGPRGLIC